MVFGNVVMRISKFTNDTSWYARIDLEEREWPPPDRQDMWINRPIRQWVYEFCEPGTFFSRNGWILFLKQEDVMQFMLTWG